MTSSAVFSKLILESFSFKDTESILKISLIFLRMVSWLTSSLKKSTKLRTAEKVGLFSRRGMLKRSVIRPRGAGI